MRLSRVIPCDVTPGHTLLVQKSKADGEAASRVRSADPKVIFEYLKSTDFALAAFKGQKLTLRGWNLQLRQPILLADGRSIASVSLQEPWHSTDLQVHTAA
jgi:hypothetical protein